jgi:hypothetical protein
MSTHPLYSTKQTFTLATTDDVPPITPLATLFEFTYDDDPNSSEFGELVLKAFDSTDKAAGKFYLGTTDPTNTTRLNYDGNLHVTNLFADNLTVGTFNDLTLTALADGFSIAGGTTERELIVTGADITLTGTGTGSELVLPQGTVTINNLTENHVLFASATDTISGEAQLAVTRGGTGIGSYAVGDILYADGTTNLAKLSIGNSNDFLRVVDGEPVWSDWDVEETATFGELIVKKYGDSNDPDTTGDLTVEGNSDLNGNVLIGGNTTIAGNLTVNGTTTTLNTEEVTIEDNLIQINSNQTGAPSSLLMSGLEVNRGDETNYRFVFVEDEKDFRVGKYDDSDTQNIIDQLQPVLTRDEVANLENNDILV